MTRPEDDERADDPIRELQQVRAEMRPPPDAERAIVQRLRAEQLIRTGEQGAGRDTRGPRAMRPAVGWRTLAAAAAIVIAFVAGRTTAPPVRAIPLAARTAASTGPQFMLLLYGAADAGGTSEADRVAAYRDWALQLRSSGRVIRGEKLDATAPRLVGAPATLPDSPSLTGFFIVGAADEQEAIALASRHPHVQNGGTIIVRRIDPT